MSESGSTLPRRQLGRYLVDWRTRAGFTQVRAAQLLEMGATSLNRLEKGQNSRVKTRDIRAIGDLYGMPEDLVTAMIGLAQQTNVKSWWHQYGEVIPKDFNPYFGLEAAAVQLNSYQPDLIPGLLQTADYERALGREAWPDSTEDEREQRVQIKLQRQNILTRRTQPATLDVVIGEPALRRIWGSHRVMAAQLRHLADVSTRPNVTVRILPLGATFPGGIPMPSFVILEFGAASSGLSVEPPVVYLEGAVGAMYLEKPQDVALYHRWYEDIRQAAKDATASRDLLRRVARELEA